MRTTARLSAVILLAASLSACPLKPPSPVTPSAQGTLVASLVSWPQYTAGYPILVTVWLQNGSAATLVVAKPELIYSIVRFSVADESGNDVPFNGPYSKLRPFDAS